MTRSNALTCKLNRVASRRLRGSRIHFGVYRLTLAHAGFYGDSEQIFGFEKCRDHDAERRDYHLVGCSQRRPDFVFPKELDCDVDSILSTGNLNRAVVRKWFHAPNFIDRAFCGCSESLHLIEEVHWQRAVGACFVSPLSYASDFVSEYSEAVGDEARSYASFNERICGTTTTVGGRDVECRDHGAAGADRGGYVPEVLCGVLSERDDRPNTVQRKESNTKQQPHKRKLSDFPRAFHSFPRIYFFGGA